MSSKSELRDLALHRRDATGPAYRSAASAAIAERIAPLIAAAAPASIAGYVAMRSEVDPAPILAAAHRRGIAIGLPAILPGAELAFRRYEPGAPLASGGFGTVVPAATAGTLDPDLIIVPVVGFDRAGARLGYGKGHYDRTIAALHARRLRPPLVGIAFALQEVDTIPAEPHDARLDVVVTETEILDFRERGADRR
ncbi:MAG: 5-formyltetrahydrofolate cyclo-ligase [Bauldia sp.]|nr:5-formyltetrahydrofolate cyclo-ligase [Bauldia sp.]